MREETEDLKTEQKKHHSIQHQSIRNGSEAHLKSTVPGGTNLHHVDCHAIQSHHALHGRRILVAREALKQWHPRQDWGSRIQLTNPSEHCNDSR